MSDVGPLPGHAPRSSPDPAYADLTAPVGTCFGPVRHFAEIDSTNRYLLDLARAGAPEGAVAVADFQSAGRGRLGRRWEAPAGANLLASVLLRPTLDPEELPLCTAAVALAAADACGRGAGVDPELKWPNDLMVGGRKLAGILAEAIPAGAELGPAVVVGLGLNVRWPPPEAAPGRQGSGTEAAASAERDEVLAVATSIWRESGVQHDPLALLELVLARLEGRLVDLADGAGRRRLAGEYRRRCTTLGKTVRVVLADEVFTGTAADITVEGHLVVDVGACLRTVAAGDVVHLRAPG
jgi:BirA family biotin operon repressor/biotin-[acetyl-CoA-carboxylase] ligase